MPQKRYEYRFHDHIRYTPVGRWDRACRIAGAVQWRDSLIRLLEFKAYYVFDHLNKKVIKDRLNISKS